MRDTPGAPFRPSALRREAKLGGARGNARKGSFGRAWQYRVPLALVVPGLLFYIIFFYLPILGNIAAFQDYQPFLGFVGSPFIGFDNFLTMFEDPNFWQALLNTIEITVLQLVFYFPAPIALALLLNGFLSNRLRRTIQSVVYIPHFMSWVVVVVLFQQLLGGNGLLDQYLRNHGVANPIDVMTDPNLFKALVTVQAIWKDTGWASIIFFAALVGVDAALYEAAVVDGASSWRRTWHVTLPALLPIITLLLILRLGTLLSVGFEQILLQVPAVGNQAGQVLDTFVYFNGVIDGQWGESVAVGLIKGLLGFLLVLGANWLAHRAGEQGVIS